jgi:hypothetical protein
MRCPNCGSEADDLLIDCSLPFGEVRDRTRFCVNCRPEVSNPRNRRYVADRRGIYPLEERVIDLAGPVVGGIA